MKIDISLALRSSLENNFILVKDTDQLMRLAFSDFGKENKIFALELKFGIDSLSPGGTG